MVALSSLLILALPISAFAESFTVTTNKNIYTPDEKAIIVGAIQGDAPSGYAVLMTVSGSSGVCAAQNILPSADKSFISRPVNLANCGLGEIKVSASYAGQMATSTFVISSSAQTDAGSKIELRVLKSVLIQAQNTVHTRVKVLIEGGYILPEEVARRYGEGVSEASLALQAMEFGNDTEAKKHMILALRDFREVLNILSEDNVARFEQTAEQRAARNDNSRIIGTYNVLQTYYYRLAELADKSGAEKQREFEDAAQLLSDARQMIDEENYEAAALALDRVSLLLEDIRMNLVSSGTSEENLATYANNTSPENEEAARRLGEAADRFEKTAFELLNETRSTDAHAKLQEALSLIASARADLEEGHLDSAREGLSAAYKAIDEARDLMKEDGKTSTSSDSNENSNSSGGNSDKNKGRNGNK